MHRLAPLYNCAARLRTRQFRRRRRRVILPARGKANLPIGGSVKEARYAAAGVDIDAGNRMVELIKPLVRATARAGADAEIGGFGGLFDLKAAGFSDPILVAATDGVGTKVKIAVETSRHDTIGIDLVAMSVNDLVVQGAEPLFFLDYFACSKLDPAVGAMVVKGIAAGCREARCALIGGETAEMPGMYQSGEYDLAGFAVGAVGRKDLLPRNDIAPGDVVIGLASSGRALQRLFFGTAHRRRYRAELGRAGSVRSGAKPGRSVADADAALCAIVPRRDPRNQGGQSACSHHRRRICRQHSPRVAEGTFRGRRTSTVCRCFRSSNGSPQQATSASRKCCARSTAASA